MNVRLWKSVVLVGLLLANVYGTLRAMQDSTAVPAKTTERPFWMWQFSGKLQPIGGENNAAINSLLAQSLGGRAPAFTTTPYSFVATPFNLSWNHNRWMFYIGYTTFGLGASTSDYAASLSSTELAYGVGYMLVNTPRFRLYPMLGNYATLDYLKISRTTTLQSLLSTLNEQSAGIYRYGGLLELAVGADYRFQMEYGDFYILAKAGYNWEVGAFWSINPTIGPFLFDANSNSFSRRGVFFQLGIGFGSERQ